MDLSQASANGVALGDWESALEAEYAICKARSSTTSVLNFSDAIFDGDDVYEYTIGSGLQYAPFTDWFVMGDSCTVNFEYQTRVTRSGLETDELSIINPLST